MGFNPVPLIEGLKLTGYKTYVAGGALIAYAAVSAYFGISTPGEAVGYFSAGLGLIGIRSKLEDITLPKNVTDNRPKA